MSTYAVDGTPLDDPSRRWLLERDSKIPAGASRRTAELDLPFHDGTIAIRQGWDTGQVSVSVAVLADGPRGGYADWGVIDQRLSTLRRVLADARELSWTPGNDIPSRVVSVVSSTVASPSRIGPGAAKIAATLTVAPFWREVGEPRESTSVLLGLPLTLDALAGTSGDSQDAIFAISGSFSTARVVGLDGSAVLLNQPVPEGRVLLVDVAGWRAWTVGLSDLLSASSSSGWPTTGSPYRLEFPPQGRLRIGPLAGRTPVLQTSGTNIGPYSFVAVKSGRWFL